MASASLPPPPSIFHARCSRPRGFFGKSGTGLRKGKWILGFRPKSPRLGRRCSSQGNPQDCRGGVGKDGLPAGAADTAPLLGDRVDYRDNQRDRGSSTFTSGKWLKNARQVRTGFLKPSKASLAVYPSGREASSLREQTRPQGRWRLKDGHNIRSPSSVGGAATSLNRPIAISARDLRDIAVQAGMVHLSKAGDRSRWH